MSSAAALVVVAALQLAGPAVTPVEVAGREAASTSHVATLGLVVTGLDAAALVAALQLRAPALRVQVADAAAPPQPGDLHLIVERGADALTVTVALADGRVYRRELASDDAEPERAAATSIAHWLAAIDAGQVAPTIAPTPVSREYLHTESVPERSAPGPLPPQSSHPIQTPNPSSPAPVGPPVTLGPVVSAVALSGVGRPTAITGLLGVAVSAGAELRLRRGPLLAAELRVMDTRAAALRLTRLRAALFAGHALVRGRFTLRTLVGVSVEPWWADGPGMPLLGGALRVTPGLRARVGPRLHAHLGLRLELAVSGTASAAAALLVEGARPVFRVGGVEPGVGLELGLAWDLRR